MIFHRCFILGLWAEIFVQLRFAARLQSFLLQRQAKKDFRLSSAAIHQYIFYHLLPKNRPIKEN
jgi:hypothetical protein